MGRSKEEMLGRPSPRLLEGGRKKNPPLRISKEDVDLVLQGTDLKAEHLFGVRFFGEFIKRLIQYRGMSVKGFAASLDAKGINYDFLRELTIRNAIPMEKGVVVGDGRYAAIAEALKINAENFLILVAKLQASKLETYDVDVSLDIVELTNEVLEAIAEAVPDFPLTFAAAMGVRRSVEACLRRKLSRVVIESSEE